MSRKLATQRLADVLARLAPLVLALGVASAVDFAWTLEWSLPECSDQSDGPVSAVFGFPLPYLRWGGYSSLVYEFAPHVYVLNVAARTAVVYGLLRLVWSRSVHPGAVRVRHATGLLGLLLCAAVLTVGPFLLSAGLAVPTQSIMGPDRSSFSLRPVGMTSGLHYRCTPSAFWFGESSEPSR